MEFFFFFFKKRQGDGGEIKKLPVFCSCPSGSQQSETPSLQKPISSRQKGGRKECFVWMRTRQVKTQRKRKTHAPMKTGGHKNGNEREKIIIIKKRFLGNPSVYLIGIILLDIKDTTFGTGNKHYSLKGKKKHTNKKRGTKRLQAHFFFF